MTVRADSAVNAKDFSAAFLFHISSLKNATQVTTLPRQNNQIHFGFGKKYIYDKDLRDVVMNLEAHIISIKKLLIDRVFFGTW